MAKWVIWTIGHPNWNSNITMMKYMISHQCGATSHHGHSEKIIGKVRNTMKVPVNIGLHSVTRVGQRENKHTCYVPLPLGAILIGEKSNNRCRNGITNLSQHDQGSGFGSGHPQGTLHE